MQCGAHAVELTRATPSVAFHAPDARGTYHSDATLPLAAPVDAQPSLLPRAVRQQWDQYEAAHHTNACAARSGEFWPHGWTPLGPLDPLTPRDAQGKIVPGPTDPQLVYGMAITAALDGQRKFCVREDPNDITYQYRNTLQQLPGSHFRVEAPGFDARRTPVVVNRFAELPELAARWVVAQLNEQMRASHPCFSLSGREHFEISNPPLQCGNSGSTPKHNPIVLIRVFESRIKQQEDHQLIYLTMEVGNAISAGSGGMFSTTVTMDARGRFTAFTPIERDQKHTFVLPRSRT